MLKLQRLIPGKKSSLPEPPPPSQDMFGNEYAEESDSSGFSSPEMSPCTTYPSTMIPPAPTSPAVTVNTGPPPPPPPPEGVYAPVPTFFQPFEGPSEGTPQPLLDIETQVRHAVYLARNGVQGLVLLSSTGEAVHLSRGERAQMISNVRQGLDAAGFDNYPILAGVLVNSAVEALECLHDAYEAGAQWGLVLAPGHFGAAASQENILEWYTFVADRSPIGLLIFNDPNVSNGLIVTPETYTRLAPHPKIVGCQMSHTNVSHHIQVCTNPFIDHSHFRVFSGLAQQLGPVVMFGAAGAIDGLAAIYPRTVTRLFDLVSKAAVGTADGKSVEEARRLQYLVCRAEELVVRWGVLGIREGIYRVLLMGSLEGGRLPLRGRLPDGEWEKWSSTIEAIQDCENS